MGDKLEVEWLYRDERYVEKLATPDVTIADMLGDLDPIKAAKSGHILSSEGAIHYGLLPRSNRGIFAINELPDLAPRIQVGLFNILQEGDIQIKGFPVRLRLDVAMVFTANPEDYTARGKIVTPLKDRIGSEIRTHYPETIELSALITASEAFSKRSLPVFVPEFVRAHRGSRGLRGAARPAGRQEERRLASASPSACSKTPSPRAERRALAYGEGEIVPRIADVYVALPAVTGKIELEYEGEMAGGAAVARDLVREGLKEVFANEFGGVNLRSLIEFFEQGGEVGVSDDKSAGDLLADAVAGERAARSRRPSHPRAKRRAHPGRRGGVHPRRTLRAEEDRPVGSGHVHRGRAQDRGWRPGSGSSRAPRPPQAPGELAGPALQRPAIRRKPGSSDNHAALHLSQAPAEPLGGSRSVGARERDVGVPARQRLRRALQTATTRPPRTT